MNRPGISVDTGPAVRTVQRGANELKVMNDLAHQIPAAEYVALLAISATLLAEACMNVCESVGLDMQEITKLQHEDPQEFQRRVVALIRSK